MEFKIINKLVLADAVKRIDITAPNIAKKIQPGQFVSVSAEEDDEHVPLTVTEYDAIKGIISITFPELGDSLKKLGALHIQDSVFSVLGPLGCPAKIEKEGVVVCIATGIGIAQILPICRAYKSKGNKVIGMVGAKTKRSLMLEPQMRLACDKMYVATEDGSYERREKATDTFQKIINNTQVDCVYAIGSVGMMQMVCSITEERGIKTLVKLNPTMADCMGMCGSCRVVVGGKTVLACIDGPEFNGHNVDFDDLTIRMNAYEESRDWGNQKYRQSDQRREPRTLTRFLSGILND